MAAPLQGKTVKEMLQHQRPQKRQNKKDLKVVSGVGDLDIWQKMALIGQTNHKQNNQNSPVCAQNVRGETTGPMNVNPKEMLLVILSFRETGRGASPRPRNNVMGRSSSLFPNNNKIRSRALQSLPRQCRFGPQSRRLHSSNA